MNQDQGHVIVRALEELSSVADLLDVTPDEWRSLLARAETHLVEQAAFFGPKELRRLGEQILQVVAPDHADQIEELLLLDAERRARQLTSLTIQRLGDGTALVRARLPESAASRLRTALESYTNPRRSGRVTSVGIPPNLTSEKMPYERRLGHAFVALLEGLDPKRLPLHGGDATTLIITMSMETLLGGVGTATLADGGRISAGEARRLACGAELVPAVLGTQSQPLDLGRGARLYSPAQRKALALRDSECRAEGCTIPATWCEAHHLEPWSAGGKTDVANGILLCAHHHHRIHDAAYQWDRSVAGDLRFSRLRC